MAPSLTISDLHRRTGRPSSALRFYERERLLTPLGRAGGMRVYDESAVERVAVIDLLQVVGFTLGEIRDLVGPDGTFTPDWRDRVEAKIEELDRRLDQLRSAKVVLEHTVTCPHESLHECPVWTQGVRSHAAALGAGRTGEVD